MVCNANYDLYSYPAQDLFLKTLKDINIFSSNGISLLLKIHCCQMNGLICNFNAKSAFIAETTENLYVMKFRFVP